MPAQDLALGAELLGHPGEVGVVGVLGGDPQGLLLAAAGDPHRDAVVRVAGRRVTLQRAREAQRAVGGEVLAGIGGAAGGPHLAHDLDALAQRLRGARRRSGSRSRRRATRARTSRRRCPSRAGPRRRRRPWRRPSRGGPGCGSPCRCTSGRAGSGRSRRRRRPSGSTPRGWPPRSGGAGVHVVVDPDRGPVGVAVDPAGQARHDTPVLRGVDADEVVAPALRDEKSELQWRSSRRPRVPRRGPHGGSSPPGGGRARRGARVPSQLRRGPVTQLPAPYRWPA